MAMIIVESGGNPDALSPSGAQGLMQLTSIAVKEVNQQYHLIGTPDLKDPYVNVCYGILLLDYYYTSTGSVKGAIITYNGGYAQLARWRNKIPLTEETANYLPRVLAHRTKFSTMFDREIPYGPTSPLQAIVNDVWADLYGTGEDNPSLILTGGMYGARVDEPNAIYCRVPVPY